MNKNTPIIFILVLIIVFGAGYIIFNRKHANQSPSANNSSVSEGKVVDLSGQQLTALPADVTSQNNISSLNLSNNQLTTLPASIRNLTNLQVLNVENNRLETLPPEIGLLKNLKTADFSNNRLTSLPAELGNLTGLKTLNLNGYKGSQSDIDQLKSKLPNTDVKS
jgi:Leucine-rich repeat (LRR) protein